MRLVNYLRICSDAESMLSTQSNYAEVEIYLLQNLPVNELVDSLSGHWTEFLVTWRTVSCIGLAINLKK